MKSLTHHPIFHDPAFPGSEVLSDAQRAMVAEVNRKFDSGDLVYEEIPCLCGSEDFDLVSTYDRYRVKQPVVLCHTCGLMQCRPRMAPSTLDWFYRSDFYRHLYDSGKDLLSQTHEKFVAMAEGRKQKYEFIKSHLDLDRVLAVGEVGCGAGWNLYNFHRDGKKIVGCDLSPRLTAAGRSEGMDIREGSSEQFGDEKFDLIILSHVVEHFSDPVKEIDRISRYLSDNGAFYIEVPDVRGFCIGALQGAHLYYFSPKLLTRYMSTIGFKPIAEEGYEGYVQFNMIFVRSANPPKVDLSREYAETKAIVKRYERREFAKQFLRKIGLFKIAQTGVNILRRF